MHNNEPDVLLRRETSGGNSDAICNKEMSSKGDEHYISAMTFIITFTGLI